MPHYILGWVDIALDQYISLSAAQQRLIDARIRHLLDDPAGPGSSHDPGTDLWTTTDNAGAGLIVYVFRVDRPRLIIMRLVY